MSWVLFRVLSSFGVHKIHSEGAHLKSSLSISQRRCESLLNFLNSFRTLVEVLFSSSPSLFGLISNVHRQIPLKSFVESNLNLLQVLSQNPLNQMWKSLFLSWANFYSFPLPSVQPRPPPLLSFFSFWPIPSLLSPVAPRPKTPFPSTAQACTWPSWPKPRHPCSLEP